MTWLLPTATSTYVVGWTDLAGPYLASWTERADERAPWSAIPRDGGEDVSKGARPSPAQTAAHAFRTEPDRYSAEFSALGGRQVRSADLITERDGQLGVRLAWSADDVRLDSDGPRTRLTATGAAPGLRVVVIIESSTDHDVISKRALIENTGDRAVRSTRAFGPSWEVPVGPGAVVGVLAGDWSREFQPFTVSLPVGELSLGSRQGITSHRYSPVVALSADDGCYGVALAWSGSWRLAVEAEPFAERVRVAGGVDDETTVITLEPGERFTTPATFGVRAPDHDVLAQRWHEFQRRVLCRDLSTLHRPVVYNSWYATTFDVRAEHQTALAEVAAELGVEVFVIDDGWFRGRDTDTRGLGDWTPDPVKFPDGLGPLAAAVERLGMRFGVWVEPEAVNPDSDLYRAHPDWVHRADDRPMLTVRNQYVLDFGRPEVLARTREWLRTLLTGAPVGYLKWDMNRPVSDGGRPGDPGRAAWSVGHTEGYYAILRMLRDEFPHVTVEACSGGGGRIDAAVLGLSDVVWTSDETGPRDRLAIQHGFLGAYPPHVMSSWVTDEPDRVDHDPTSFEFRFLVAMAGVLGIGSDLLAWSANERRRAADLVARYRGVRSVVHTGTVWRHGRPADPVYALEYATAGRVVIMVWARPGRPDPVTVTPRTPGLAPVEVPFLLAPDCDLIVLDR